MKKEFSQMGFYVIETEEQTDVGTITSIICNDINETVKSNFGKMEVIVYDDRTNKELLRGIGKTIEKGLEKYYVTEAWIENECMWPIELYVREKNVH